ncbi:hypothetical protein EOA33_16890 [Mesorhizobium sp. M4A.F.Ca.ET.050.02.1.1]|uniref:hypothetical protein n=1 Tax=Mesorhizobium sp. M4A.F.Ca.ET.050.02.1.1 TaxID=2496754 RepID=UPI000FCBBB4D|nr:hypothetical protein [Mesorhizobium sp. M4A.F.Ca.ET.050.02.1.1]RUX47997.1 hypothetical protein EOA33_16890 [Mesorhizobium sp. M4A.F.Ca.ET.050.02.1.1]
MNSNSYQDKAGAFAAGLMLQAAWPLLAVAACLLAAPVIGLVAAAAALATLAFTALLLFDALLFRLMASHDSEVSGGGAVDDLLARMRLKPMPAATRSLDQRISGTRRLLMKQRMAFAVFAAASLMAALL